MKWQQRSGSSNVEDRRGARSGFGGMRPFVSGKGGILVLLVVLVAGYYGIDLTPLLTGGQGMNAVQTSSIPPEQEQQMAQFTSVALKTTEDVWENRFRKMGRAYAPPRLVLYTGGTSSGCGYGQSAMGPFYCPADSTVYIDLSFYQDMKARMGGGGDFAQGYVIAHEVGHHVQRLLGIDQKMRRMQQGAPEKRANQLSVMLELQADCFAGVWGHAMKKENIMEPGDLEEALNTAQAIGDDRLQRQSTGRVIPDSFTHGSSRQRYTWFKRGFDSGDPNMCDTFSEPL